MDLLIIDTQMHVDEGIKLVQQVRPACPDLPILMISTGDTADEVRGAIRAGVDAYLAEPFFAEATAGKSWGVVRLGCAAANRTDRQQGGPLSSRSGPSAGHLP